MNIFPKVAVNTAEALNKKTDSILGVFTKTITDLREVVKTAADQIVVKTEEIRAAEAEREALHKIVDKNEQIITKLEDFVN